MEDRELSPLFEYYHKKLSAVNRGFKRNLYPKINWKSKLIGIKGARGTGKSTLLLQHIIENFPKVDDTLYVSLDNLWFKTHSFWDLVQWADSHGLTHLFIDEVHYLPSWAQNLKNVADAFPDMHFVYTGSSMLSVNQSEADLSRRQTLYHLSGMSFREFLEFEGVMALPLVLLPDLLENHVDIALKITKETKILPLFERYLQNGYYPFYKEAGDDYLPRLQSVINTIIDSDIPAVSDVTYGSLQKTKQLLMVLAENMPNMLTLSDLFRQIETTRDAGLLFLNLLDSADLLKLYSERARNYKNLVSPQKIYLNNTNLMYALTARPDTGCVRETFFMNQLSELFPVSLPGKGDFLVNTQEARYLFEVGGKSKNYKQIADIKDSFLAVADTETGHGNRIPLWMFGLLY